MLLNFYVSKSSLSGNFIGFLDPNKKYIPEKYGRQSGGIRIDIKKNPLKLKLFAGQFNPYNIRAFQLNLSYRPAGRDYPGTVIRLPLRGEEGARISSISNRTYGARDFPRLTQDFQSNKFHYMLFLKNVNSVSLLQGDSKTEEDPSNMCEVKKTTEILSTVDNSLCSNFFQNSIVIQESSGVSQREEEKHFLIAQKRVEDGSDAHKLSISDRGKEHGLNLSVSVAIPLVYDLKTKTYKAQRMSSGKVFTFLPLNIESEICFHINAGFALSSNRKTIWQDDNRGSNNDIRVQWNEALTGQQIPMTIINLLQEIKGNSRLSQGCFDTLWPSIQKSSIFSNTAKGFYKLIVKSENKLIFSNVSHKWLNYKNSYMSDFSELKPELRTTFQHVLLQHLKQDIDPGAELVEFGSLALQGIENELGVESVRTKTYSITRFYLEAFLPRFSKTEEVKRDLVLAYILQNEIQEDVSRVLKETSCFKTSYSGKLLKPKDLVSPSGTISKLFLEEEDCFPHVDFHKSLIAMSGLGMLQSISSDVIKNRAHFLHNRKSSFTMNIAKLQPVSSLLLHEVKLMWDMKCPLPELSELCWIESNKLELCRADTLWSPAVKQFVSFSKKVFKDHPKYYYSRDFMKAIGIQDSITVNDVVNQLLGFQLNFPTSVSERRTISDQMMENLQKLGDIKCERKNIEPLNGIPLFYDKESNKLYPLNSVTFDSITVSLSPYILKINPVVVENMKGIMLDLGAKEKCSSEDLIRVIAQINNDYNGEPIGQENIEKVVSILSHIVKEGSITSSSMVLAPNKEGKLVDVKTLSYNDAAWIKMDSFQGTFIHKSLSRDHAMALGAKMVRSRVLGQFASDDFQFGDPFGQNEKLTTRIKNILDEYSGEIDIFKEMIQNADDAQAHKIHFILDERDHKTETVFNEQSKYIQGPALCVFNDKNFAPEDYEGLQNLGIGSKRSSEESIGKFGIGFNTVYSITDTPMFVSNNDLVVLDPHRAFVPCAEVGKPGGRFPLSPEFKQRYGDIVNSFDMNGVVDMGMGTLFRLPLRNGFQSEIVDAKNQSETCLSMKKKLQEFEQIARYSLLFLNNITEIDISYIDANGSVSSKASFCSEKQVTGSETSYNLTIKAEGQTNVQTDYYKVARSSVEEPEAKGYKSRRADAAVAINMKHFEIGEKEQGKIYVGLPLKEPSTLPIHIHGNFALDHGRNGLLPESSWNTTVLKGAVCIAYLQLLEDVRLHLQT